MKLLLILTATFLLTGSNPACASYQCGPKPPRPYGCDFPAQCVCFVDEHGNESCGWTWTCR